MNPSNLWEKPIWNDGPQFEALFSDPYAQHPVVNRHILNGGGKGGGSSGPTQQQVTSTSTTSNIPDYASGYFTDILNRASGLSQQNYQPYQGDQIAPLNATQNQALQNVSNNQGNYQPYFNQASQSYQNAGQWNPQQASNTYQAQNYTPDQYTGSNVSQYMNPYVQQSLQPQIALQNQQFAQQGQQLQSQAAANGAFGGYRDALQQSQNTLYNNLANQNLIGQGYNQAFQNAQNQFNTSQGQQAQAAGLNAQNQQAQSSLGMTAVGQNNQFGFGQAQLGLGIGQAQQGLGQSVQQAGLNDSNALLQAGTVQQNQSQNGLNVAYQNYLNQQYAPYQQLNWYSGILRGVPVTANQNVTGYQTPPSPVSQLAGLGLGAAGLSQLMG